MKLNSWHLLSKEFNNNFRIVSGKDAYYRLLVLAPFYSIYSCRWSSADITSSKSKSLFGGSTDAGTDIKSFVNYKVLLELYWEFGSGVCHIYWLVVQLERLFWIDWCEEKERLNQTVTNLVTDEKYSEKYVFCWNVIWRACGKR